MIYPKEKIKLIKKYSKLIKELGNKEYNRFRFTVYYFPEILEEKRLNTFYKILKNQYPHAEYHYLNLKEYEMGVGTYKLLEDHVISVMCCGRLSYYLKIEKFWEFFNI